jgi:hypothetical protein
MMIIRQRKPGPHPSPSPGGGGEIKPFSLREKGWDEGRRCLATVLREPLNKSVRGELVEPRTIKNAGISGARRSPFDTLRANGGLNQSFLGCGLYERECRLRIRSAQPARLVKSLSFVGWVEQREAQQTCKPELLGITSFCPTCPTNSRLTTPDSRLATGARP